MPISFNIMNSNITNGTAGTVLLDQPVFYYILIVNVIIFVCYFFFWTIFIVDAKHFIAPYYVIMEYLCLADLCVLVSLIVFHASYNRLITKNERYSYAMRYISDRFADAAYFTTLFINILVGLNRFAAIVFFDTYRHVFTNFRTTLAVLIAFFSGYSLSCLYFVWEDFFQPCSMLLTVITLCFIFSCYTISLIVSYVRIRAATTTTETRKQLIKEMKMLLQTTMIAIIILVQEVVYIITASNDLDYNPTFSIVYVFYCGSNPVILSCFDHKIQRSLKANVQKLFCHKIISNVIPNTSTIATIPVRRIQNA